jgi:hypothetical protein
MSLTGSSLQISASIICQKCLIEKRVDFHLESNPHSSTDPVMQRVLVIQDTNLFISIL